MIDAFCEACSQASSTPHLTNACRHCGARALVRFKTAAEFKREAHLARRAVKWQALPEEGRKLRLFMDQEGITQRSFAKHLTRLGQPCSPSFLNLLIHGKRQCRVPLARTIAEIMRRRGYEPAKLCDDLDRFAKGARKRRDYRRWKERRCRGG
jgi:hypothetical protein